MNILTLFVAVSLNFQNTLLNIDTVPEHILSLYLLPYFMLEQCKIVFKVSMTNRMNERNIGVCINI